MFKITKILNQSSKKMLTNISWVMFLELINSLIPLIVIPYITRTVGASGYGAFVVAYNIISYANVIVIYGFRYSGTKKVAILEACIPQLSHLFSCILLGRVFLLLIAFSGSITYLYLTDMESNYLSLVLCLFTMVLATALQQSYMYQGLQNMKPLVVCNAIGQVGFIVCTFIFVKSQADLNSYCLFYGLGYLVSNSLSIVLLNRKYGIGFHWPSMKSVFLELKEGWILFLTAAMTTITSAISVTVLAQYMPSEDVGIYDGMNKIIQIVVVLYTPIMQNLYPFFCKKYIESFDKGYQTVKKVGWIVLIFFTLFLLGIYLLRKPLIMIILGSEFLRYNQVIIPLAINFIFGIVDNFLGVQILVATGNEALYAKAFLLYSFISVTITVFLTKQYFVWGAAVANPLSAAIFTIILICMVWHVKQKMKVSKKGM